jgi:hypothetical protein
MTKPTKPCKLCGKNPKEVPDRESGSPNKAICRQCHGRRLQGDLREIMRRHSAQEKPE